MKLKRKCRFKRGGRAMKNNPYSYHNLPFTKIYWSRLVNLYIGKDKLYKCICCDKNPIECNNENSATEYRKINQFMNASRLFGTDVDYPIYETGWIRVDQHGRDEARVVWKIQRELAKRAGFDLLRSQFM